MANVYVYSGAAGAADGSTWADAYTTLAAALTAKAAGDDFWVADDHAETQASAMTMTSPGTLAAPCRILCARRSGGSVPPVAADLRTTATITTTGNNAMIIGGAAYIYGIIFSTGTTAVSATCSIGGATQNDLTFDNCAVRLGGTTTPHLFIGSTSNSIGCNIVWNNTTWQVAAAASTISAANGVNFTWKNTGATAAVTGATMPNILFGVGSSQNSGKVVCDGLDLNALSGKTLVAAMTKGGDYFFKDCKLPASITIAAAQTASASNIHVIRSANGATAYTLEKHTYQGAQTTETTITRTGGASINGAAVAMKIVTTANAKYQAPFVSTPLVVANSTTGTNRTVTVYGIWGGGAVPNNDDIWIEVAYLGTAGSPVASFASTGKATVLSANAATTADSSTWGGSTTDFKMVATLSSPQPALAGEIYVTVKAGAASSTFYIDPKVELG
jgi:hypothetical protein